MAQLRLGIGVEWTGAGSRSGRQSLCCSIIHLGSRFGGEQSSISPYTRSIDRTVCFLANLLSSLEIN